MGEFDKCNNLSKNYSDFFIHSVATFEWSIFLPCIMYNHINASNPVMLLSGGGSRSTQKELIKQQWGERELYENINLKVLNYLCHMEALFTKKKWSARLFGKEKQKKDHLQFSLADRILQWVQLLAFSGVCNGFLPSNMNTRIRKTNSVFYCLSTVHRLCCNFLWRKRFSLKIIVLLV